jgi:VIT1/CCC1 family predicted Fe2+/Mn2+ transporter
VNELESKLEKAEFQREGDKLQIAESKVLIEKSKMEIIELNIKFSTKQEELMAQIKEIKGELTTHQKQIADQKAELNKKEEHNLELNQQLLTLKNQMKDSEQQEKTSHT